ncbi:MAG: hypothetical protein ACSHWS_14000 [Sulfitobacter sp.]
MNVLYLILGIGMTASALVIAAFIIVDKIVQRGRRATDIRIANDYISTPEINPGLMMSKLGSKQSAQRSLDTMILRPTWGIKLFGWVMAVLVIMAMSGPSGAPFREDLLSWAVVGSILIYLGAFLSIYEVRYDSDGITAPGMFFRPKYHPWSEFISVEKADNVHYKLVFEGGTLKIKKFLVGMPTLLTFVADIRDMNQRA